MLIIPVLHLSKGKSLIAIITSNLLFLFVPNVLLIEKCCLLLPCNKEVACEIFWKFEIKSNCHFLLVLFKLHLKEITMRYSTIFHNKKASFLVGWNRKERTSPLLSWMVKRCKQTKLNFYFKFKRANTYYVLILWSQN